ncbi:MAG: hypothetical protein QOI66_4342 [Myxococcales bacterium]|nr:hypothetical protein [Myxococcales bacterium]
MTVMVLLVSTVVAISVLTLRRGSGRVLREFRTSPARLAEGAASGLQSYLDSFDRDTRLLAALAARTRRQSIDAPGQDQVIWAAFDALATVVAHYRTIALFGPHQPPIVAVDPTEDRALMAPLLVQASAALARESSTTRQPILRGPVALAPGRWFYLYAAPVGDSEAVVVTADAALMLEVIWRGRAGRQNLVVVDPSGAVWFGCEERQRCRLLRKGEALHQGLVEILDAADSSEPVRPSASASSLGLPARLVVGKAPPVSVPLGQWSVSLLASAADIAARERQLLLQLVLTSAGVIGVMLIAGALTIRQQARAAELAARLQAAQEMATLRERSDKILENVPMGIMGMTRDARVAMVNRFFAATLSTYDPAGWASVLREHLDRALATGRTQIVTDVAVRSAPGNIHDYDVRVVPLSRPADDVAALLLWEDLSELRGLQRQLVRAEKLITVGVLSAGIAHEIGTPLSVIRGRAEHLLERVSEIGAAEDLRAIVAQIDRISSTIRQVLEFSRTSRSQIGPTDVRTVIDKALGLLDWRITNKRFSVQTTGDQSLPPIAADAQQFEQVLVNLLMNACDASPPGGKIEIHTSLDAGPSPPVLRLEVIDHGAGIAATDLNSVFDPYFTTKKRGEGTGLGLAIVSQVVRNHHGTVALASTVDVGTTVTILWPVAAAQEAVAHA